MCLFRNKGIIDIKFNIIEKGVLEEFCRGVNSPTLKINIKWNSPPYKIVGTKDNNNYITISFLFLLHNIIVQIQYIT